MSEETIPQMRERIDSLKDELSKLEKSNTSLAKDNHRLKARDLAREQGLPASRGDLFATHNPEAELTAQNLIEFVDEFELTASEATDEADADSEGGESSSEPTGDGNESLSSLSRSGSRAGDGSPGGAENQQMTRAEWRKLYSENPAAAKEAVASGRVALSEGNPYNPVRGGAGENPYVPSEV